MDRSATNARICGRMRIDRRPARGPRSRPRRSVIAPPRGLLQRRTLFPFRTASTVVQSFVGHMRKTFAISDLLFTLYRSSTYFVDWYFGIQDPDFYPSCTLLP